MACWICGPVAWGTPAAAAAAPTMAANSRQARGSNARQALRGVVQSRDAKPKDVFQPVRVALAGTTVSPGIFETLEVLGRDESLARIDAALRT